MKFDKVYVLQHENIGVIARGKDREDAKNNLVEEVLNDDSFIPIKEISHYELLKSMLYDSKGHLTKDEYTYRDDLEKMSSNQKQRHILNTIDKNARKFWNKQSHLAKEYSRIVKSNFDINEIFIKDLATEELAISDELDISICSFGLDIPNHYNMFRDFIFKEMTIGTSNIYTVDEVVFLYGFLEANSELENITVVKADSEEEAKQIFALNSSLYKEQKNAILYDGFLFKLLQDNGINLFDELDNDYTYLQTELRKYFEKMNELYNEEFEEIHDDSKPVDYIVFEIDYNSDDFINVIIDNLNNEPILGLDFEQKCKIDYFFKQREKEGSQILPINLSLQNAQVLFGR